MSKALELSQFANDLLVDSATTTITNLLATGDGEFSGDLTVDGNLIVNGTTVTVSTANLAVSDNMIYLNNGIQATITGASGDGATVTYTSDNNYTSGMIVTVTGVTPTSFNVTNQTITAATSSSFSIASSNTDTYVSGGTARAKTSINPDLGFAGGYNDGSYAHAGFFRDATDGRWKVFKGYTPEPDLAQYIDTSHASFALADFQAAAILGTTGTFTGSVTLSSDFTVDTTTFKVDAANNRVGIGTNTPGVPLDVLFSGDNGVRIRSTNSHASLYVDSPATFGTYLRFRQAGVEKYWINGDATTNNLFFRPSGNAVGTDTIAFTQAGNIGVGTTVPDSRMHLYSTTGDTILTIEADADNDTEEDNPQIHFLTDGGLRTAAITGGNATNEGSPNNFNALNLQSQTIRFHTGASQDFNLTSERMRIADNGRVGIGTTVPRELLDVRGTIIAGDGSGTGGSRVLRQEYSGSANTLATLGTMQSSGGWLLGYGIDPKSGTAGYVSSFDNFSGKRTALEFTNTAMQIHYAPAQQTTVGSDITGLITPFYFDLDGQRLGIGTNAPNAPLDVRGQTLINGAAGNGGKADFAVDVGGQPVISILHSDNEVLVGSTDVNFNGRVTHDSSSFQFHAWDSNILIYTTASAGSTTGRDIIFSPQAATGGAATERMRIKGETGYVGIGTNAPIVADLHILGGSGASGQSTTVKIGPGDSTTSNHTSRLELAETGNNTNMTYGFSITADGNGTNSLLIRNHENSISGNVAMSVDRPTGNVGIGTAVPYADLHTHADNYRMAFGATTSNLAAQHRIEFWETAVTATSTNANFAIEYDGTANYGGDGALLFRGSASAPISTQDYVFAGISRSGESFFMNNVGVGTTNPIDALDIRGNVTQIDGSPEYHFGTSSASHYNWRVAAQEVVSGGFEIASGTQVAGTSASSDTYTTRFTIKADTGNVGIGTTQVTDAARLQVYDGASQASGTLWLETAKGTYVSHVHHGTNADWYIRGGTSSGKIYIQDSHAADIVMATGGGNVGIGTITPDTPLHIYEASVSPVMLTLHNYTSDISGLGTHGNFIDFKMTDDNATATPQVRIGMTVYDSDGVDAGVDSEGNGNFVVYTSEGSGGAGAGSLTEKFRVSEKGFVGIGSTIPGVKLDVDGGSGYAARFKTTSDVTIELTSSDGWTGIRFNDSGAGSDDLWHNGVNGTFAFGGGGANVAGKKLHVDGGMSIGVDADATVMPTNGLYVQGNTTVAGGTVYVDRINPNTAQQLVLNAGESISYATGQTAELVYINAEAGVEINSSPDNWVSGWAGRNTTTICGTSGQTVMTGTGSDMLTARSNNASYTGVMVGNTGSGDAAFWMDASNGDFAGGDYASIRQTNSGLHLLLRTETNAGDIRFEPSTTLVARFTDNVNASSNGGLQIITGYRIGFDESGVRSWNLKAQSGNLEAFSGDGNGAFRAPNIGINVTPAQRLHVYESADSPQGANKPTTVALLAARTDSTNEGPSIDFASVWTASSTYQPTNDDTGWVVGRIAGVYDATASNGGALTFYTNAGPSATLGSDYANLAERMRIDPLGNVGIGTSDVGAKFEVYGTAGQLFSIADSMSGTIFSVNDASGIPSIEVEDTGEIRLAEFSGNVLIGTATDDGHKLKVEGNIKAKALQLSDTNPVIYFNGTSDGGDGASSDMAIIATPEGLDFIEPEDTGAPLSFGGKVHFRIGDDTGVSATYGYQVNGTTVIDSSRNLTNIGTASLSGALTVGSGSITFSQVAGSSTRNNGIIGTYSPNTLAAIWSMGAAYQISANGSSGGTLYGMNYSYNPDYQAAGANPGAVSGLNHQFQWRANGTTQTAIGTGIYTVGDVTAYSDIRVKTNIKIIDNALEKVHKIHGYTFDRTDTELDPVTGEEIFKPRQAGVIAQEIQEVLPEVVRTAQVNDHLSVAYDRLSALLIEAVKEADNKIVSQQEKIDAQQAQIDQLTELVNKLLSEK